MSRLFPRASFLLAFVSAGSAGCTVGQIEDGARGQLCPRSVEADDFGSEESALGTRGISGVDDRFPWAEAAPFQRTVYQRTIALIASASDDFRADCPPRQPTLETTPLELCSGERFDGWPTAGYCSGVLVDGDVILTAGHCLALDPTCKNTRFVFGFRMIDATSGATIQSRQDVYGCKEVLLERYAGTTITAGKPHDDFAFLKLDRPVRAPLRPARIPCLALGADGFDESVRGAREPGVALESAGHPMGLPMLVSKAIIHDNKAFANFRSADLLTYSIDSNRGLSGAPVFDAQGALAAVHIGATTTGNAQRAIGSDAKDDLITDASAGGCKRWAGAPDAESTGLGVPIERVIATACRRGLRSYLCGNAPPVPPQPATIVDQGGQVLGCGSSAPKVSPRGCKDANGIRRLFDEIGQVACPAPAPPEVTRSCRCALSGWVQCSACPAAQ
jgi:hypothetical protein